jgi:myo-inositol 2-dehydrogenase/D-chiro-inositol 1-dehydrogenase
MSQHDSHKLRSDDRREFMKRSSLAVAGTTLLGSLSLGRSAHAAGSDMLKIGLVGCGGRGTGAAAQAIKADANCQLTAMGDAFVDRLDGSLKNLQGDPVLSSKVDVPKERQFVGFGAYKQVIDSGVDVVLLAGPPGFRPQHFKYAIEKGKHVFAEKPVAVDAPGVHSVLATAEEAKKKNLSVVSGLCYRYDESKRQTIKRIHDGAVGDIMAMHVSYNTGPLWSHPRQPAWSDMENQIRNWTYYTWLAGDLIVEQHIHSLDKACWVMNGEMPIKATGLGGRQVRIQPQFGNVYDHMAVFYEYKNGAKLFSNCRQQAGCSVEVSDYIYGTKGTAELMRGTIEPREGEKWRFRGESPNMYDQEHRELFASIRSGTPINNGEYMCMSTMIAIMGRMTCYTGRTLTWDECFNSTQDLMPSKLEWGPIETPAVAMPGITPFA